MGVVTESLRRGLDIESVIQESSFGLAAIREVLQIRSLRVIHPSVQEVEYWHILMCDQYIREHGEGAVHLGEHSTFMLDSIFADATDWTIRRHKQRKKRVVRAAAKVLVCMNESHPFYDGNKRISHLVLMNMCISNGFMIVEREEIVQLIYNLAQSESSTVKKVNHAEKILRQHMMDIQFDWQPAERMFFIESVRDFLPLFREVLGA